MISSFGRSRCNTFVVSTDPWHKPWGFCFSGRTQEENVLKKRATEGLQKKGKGQKPCWKMVKVNFVLSLSPLLFVLVGILFLKKPAMKVAPLVLIYSVLIAFTYFNGNGLEFKQMVTNTDALLWQALPGTGGRSWSLSV